MAELLSTDRRAIKQWILGKLLGILASTVKMVEILSSANFLRNIWFCCLEFGQEKF